MRDGTVIRECVRVGVEVDTGFQFKPDSRINLPSRYIIGTCHRRESMSVQSAVPTLVPPFTHETAVLKVRKGEDGWNTRDPQKVSLVYTPDSV